MRTEIQHGGWLANRRNRAAILGLLMVLGLACGSRNVLAVDVTIELPSTVPITGPTTVTVTLTPSPSPEPVILTVRPVFGTGAAEFLPGRLTQVTLRETTTLELVGTGQSGWEGNMLLDATVRGSGVAGARFSVVDPRMLSFAQAIQFAREAIRGRITPQRGAPILVELYEDRYVAWFGKLDYNEIDRGLPVVRGSAITVILDAFTGRLIQLVSSPS